MGRWRRGLIGHVVWPLTTARVGEVMVMGVVWPGLVRDTGLLLRRLQLLLLLLVLLLLPAAGKVEDSPGTVGGVRSKAGRKDPVVDLWEDGENRPVESVWQDVMAGACSPGLRRSEGGGWDIE